MLVLLSDDNATLDADIERYFFKIVINISYDKWIPYAT